MFPILGNKSLRGVLLFVFTPGLICFWSRWLSCFLISCYCSNSPVAFDRCRSNATGPPSPTRWGQRGLTSPLIFMIWGDMKARLIPGLTTCMSWGLRSRYQGPGMGQYKLHFSGWPQLGLTSPMRSRSFIDSRFTGGWVERHITQNVVGKVSRYATPILHRSSSIWAVQLVIISSFDDGPPAGFGRIQYISWHVCVCVLVCAFCVHLVSVSSVFPSCLCSSLFFSPFCCVFWSQRLNQKKVKVLWPWLWQ